MYGDTLQPQNFVSIWVWSRIVNDIVSSKLNMSACVRRTKQNVVKHATVLFYVVVLEFSFERKKIKLNKL